MRKIKWIGLSLTILLTSSVVRADEGMWLLSMLNGYTIEDMQSKGFKLTAEDIYSVNQACLKDAVVIFGGGCTGELISGEGLVLTNHHCGYGAIQSHSSVENDYLTDGFWAMSRDEELPNPGLSVHFLRYMEDVTQEVREGVTPDMGVPERDEIIRKNMAQLSESAGDGAFTYARVVPMFYGNQYFIFVYQEYKDVRLVGAPPSAVGNFGQDTDNWVWPRHTGDFSLFRIYANENNEPVAYSEENVPYEPKKFLEISLDGVEKGDFTMVMGYPGSTRQFLYSDALDQLMNSSLPMKIDLRTQRMDIMDSYMKSSDKVRIQYASKFRRVTNAWKKWQGAIKGLIRLDAIEVKQELEAGFAEWVAADAGRQKEYGTLLDDFESIYADMADLQVISDLANEAVFSPEIFRFVSRFPGMMKDSTEAELIQNSIEGSYKDYYMPIDREIFAAMMQSFRAYAPEDYHPSFFETVDKKYSGDFTKYAEWIFSKSYFASEESMNELLSVYEKKQAKAIKKIEADPMVEILEEFRTLYMQVLPQINVLEANLDELYAKWVRGLFAFQPEKRFYPDANFTMRVTYGKVDGYYPEDAVRYTHQTTLEGVIEKGKEGVYDYVVPEKLESLYENKNYAPFGEEDGTMPVCFAASNHTSGGNSGSPVLDANGRLIGLNFDRNWHGTMSDEMYDPEMCRNIAVDIRYVLFIIDKFAGAGYLLDEMELVSKPKEEVAQPLVESAY